MRQYFVLHPLLKRLLEDLILVIFGVVLFLVAATLTDTHIDGQGLSIAVAVALFVMLVTWGVDVVKRALADLEHIDFGRVTE